jgi:hypothetical protein
MDQAKIGIKIIIGQASTADEQKALRERLNLGKGVTFG